MTPAEFDLPRGRIRRTMPLAGFTARAAGGRIVAGLREKAGNDGSVERFHECTAERYTEILGHSKGVLMKVGQMMSLIGPDAFGDGGFSPYQRALSRLRTEAPAMTGALVHKTLSTEIGQPRAHFAHFDDEPMAAASIGQVHRATLLDGRDVVVKLQYPGVAQAIQGDLANTELLATFLRFAVSAAGMGHDMRSLARESAARISEEIDYQHEAASLVRFADLYRGHPFIRIPEVVPEASGDRVLTMTYLPGVDWPAAQHADQELKSQWAEVVCRFVHGNFRHDNLLYADPHPGNFRFNADGSVGFVDFGCVKVLPERIRRPWVAMTRAALEDRFDDCKHLMSELGFFSHGKVVTTEELRRWWGVLLFELTETQHPVTFTSGATSRLFDALFSTRAENPVRRMTTPHDFSMFPRVQLSLAHIGAGLGATFWARAMFDDMDGIAEPATELGKLHHAWVRERGLPLGLDHHDRP